MPIRRRGGNPYPEGEPKFATIFKERDRWYVTVLYEIAAPVIPDNGVVAGIDRKASGMIAVVYSDDRPGEVIDKPTKGIYAIKKKRKQRKLARQLARQKKDGRKQLSNRAKKTQRQIARVSRKEANCRHDRNHQNSRKIANQSSVVVVAKLPVRGMTKSGRGTKEKPGRNVRQAEHADLNATANILASGTGATGRARGDPLGIPTTRQMTERSPAA